MELQQDLMPSMSITWEGRQGQPQARNGLTASRGEIETRDDGTQDGETEIYSVPEDIMCHIHSLMPMRDAARAACVSHAFLCAWRCRPHLIFNNKTFGLTQNACGKDEISRDFYSNIDQILKKHSGVGIKTLKLQISSDYIVSYSYLDSWLQTAVTPGIEELELTLSSMKGAKYNLPYSLFANGSGESIRYLRLVGCSFRPKVALGWLKFRSLRKLHLCAVGIRGDELGRMLSNSFALEKLKLAYCDEIVCLKIPCLLQRLSRLKVFGCSRLTVVENEAPYLSSFFFQADFTLQISLGETLRMKSLEMFGRGAIYYTRAQLSASMPNLETLTICSSGEAGELPIILIRREPDGLKVHSFTSLGASWALPHHKSIS
ncbi:hypothetical protein ACP70R_002036 [Stipagrostis hirtigluma subsp. patula]